MRIRFATPYLFAAMSRLSLRADPTGAVADPPVVTDPPVVDDAAKTAADTAAAAKATADAAAAAETAKAENLAAIKNVLKLPENTNLDPALTERTAATLSELGLDPDKAQKVFGLTTQEIATHVDKAVAAVKEAHQPGGAEFVKLHEANKTALLAHPDFGGGKPDQYEANVGLVKRYVATLANAAKASADELKALETDPVLTSPLAMRVLLAGARSTAEDKLVLAPSRTTGEPSAQEKLDRLYPSMAKKKD